VALAALLLPELLDDDEAPPAPPATPAPFATEALPPCADDVAAVDDELVDADAADAEAPAMVTGMAEVSR
jgi:hypothetical protein